MDVKAKFTLRVLGPKVDLTGRGIEPFGDEDEVVDELLHAHEDTLFLGKPLLRVDDVDRSIRQSGDGLAEDRGALAHLLHADEVTVVAIAHRADRDVELVAVVIEVGIGLAHVVIDTGATEIGTAQAPGDGVFLRDDPDVACAVEEDLVPGKKGINLVETDEEFVAELQQLLGETLGKIANLASNAGVARRETRPGEKLAKIVDRLALGEGVEEDGHRADVHGVGTEAEEVGRDARHLAADRADRLAARREFPAHQLFHREGVSDVVGERSEVIEPVRVGHELVVLHVLGDLLVTAVQETDVGISLGDDFAVEFENETKHPVRRRVRGPHVENELFPDQILGRRLIALEGLGAGARVLDFDLS